MVDDDTPLLTGLDGRKMSKSYGNTIPLFGDPSSNQPQVDGEKALRKAIMRIVTNSQLPEEPKIPMNPRFLRFIVHSLARKNNKYCVNVLSKVSVGGCQRSVV